MSAIEIRPVENARQLETFIQFRYDLYRGDPYDAPNLHSDEVQTLSPYTRHPNAAFEFCEAQYFLAYRDGRVVGRVAAIINHRYNEQWQRPAVRVGWIDFIDDTDVSRALLTAVEQWGRERGMKEIIGPLGFTDMDPEGMLYEGFEELGTMATSYNYPYYMDHMPPLGYEKDNDWIEYRMEIPRETGVPPRLARVADIVQEKYGLQIMKYKTTKEIAKNYGRELFEVLNEGMQVLYGYSMLSDKQIDQYVKMYLPVVDPKLVSLIADKDGRLIGTGICMPSLSKALQKCGGKLFPFGWYHLLKALKWKHDNHIDMLLIAVRPEWQSRGVNALFFKDLLPFFISEGYDWCETSVEMESNTKVQQQWVYFERRIHKRRRSWIKKM